MVVDAGGPAAFINARPTSDRRFLVEQMAVLELIGQSLQSIGLADLYHQTLHYDQVLTGVQAT